MTHDEQDNKELRDLAKDLAKLRPAIQKAEKELDHVRNREAIAELLYRRKVLWMNKDDAERRLAKARNELDAFNQVMNDGARSARARLEQIKRMEAAS